MAIETYYFLRDENKVPRITVCLMLDGDSISRGVAICSLKDNPVKKVGKVKARGRALAAIKTKRSNSVFYRDEAWDVVDMIEKGKEECIEDVVEFDYEKMEGYKAIYNPKLTPFEASILQKAIEKQSKIAKEV